MQDDAKRQRARELSAEVTKAQDAWREGGETGPLRMSRAAFHSIHLDFRSKRGDSSHPSCAGGVRMKRKEKPPLVAIGLHADRSNAQHQAARYRQPGLVTSGFSRGKSRQTVKSSMPS